MTASTSPNENQQSDVLSREILSLAGGQKRARKPKFFDSDDDSEVEIGQIDSPSAVATNSHLNTTNTNSSNESDKYDDDLMGDEEDRLYLSRVTEVEREAILFERSEARRLRQERKELKRKLVQRESGPTAAKRKLSQPKSKRTYQRRQHQEEEDEYSSQDNSESSAYEEENEADSKRSSSSSNHHHHKAQNSFSFQNTNNIASTALEEMSYEQALQITLSRRQLEKLLSRIFLEEVACDAFVRVSSGTRENGETLYRFAQVNSITEYPKTYRLNEVETNKALVLAYGKAKKTFRLDLLSNSPPTEAEFKRWKWEMQQCSLSIPKSFQAQEKAEQINSLQGKAITDQEIDQLLKKKQLKTSRTIALQKIELIGKRELALQAADSQEVAKLDAEIAALEQELTSRSASAAFKSTKPNEKVVYFGANFSTANSNGGSSKSSTNPTNSPQIDSIHDPFARRKCNPTIIHAANMKDSLEDLPDSQTVSQVDSNTSIMTPLAFVDYEALHNFAISLGGGGNSDFFALQEPISSVSLLLPAVNAHNKRYNLW